MSASLWTRFVSGAAFPIHERLKGHASVARRKELEQSQWWTPGELENFRLERLRRFLREVGMHVPYYRRLFADRGFDPEKIWSLADLERLPFLTKSVIRANTEALKSERSGVLKRYNTGGSSGEPLVFYIGKERVTHDIAAKWRATRWWGVDIGDPEIVVWGSPIELGAQDRMRSVRDWVLRSELLPAFEMSEPKLDEFIERIRRRRPRMLFGYPSALAHIAKHAAARAQRLDSLGIEVAFVTAERLYDDQREAIAKVFGCRLANGYGGRDAGFIAHECPAGGMHITAEDVIVEIVDGEGRVLPPGQSGEVVVTHLATGAFPFIRYRTGDVAALDTRTCPCGRSLPLIKEIQGRTTDFVVAADGTVMHGLALIYVIRDLPGVASFKIVQESVHKTRVMIVPGSGYSVDVTRSICNGFKARLGNDVEVAVEQVGNLPPEQSGKFRYVVSNVASGGAREAKIA